MFHDIKVESAKLRAYAPYPSVTRALSACGPACLRALPIINTGFTCLRAYAPLPSSISTLHAFFSSRVVLFQLERKVPMFCLWTQINQSPPVSLSFFYFTI